MVAGRVIAVNILKILFAIEFVLIIAISTLFLIDNRIQNKIPTAYVVKENTVNETIDFKLLTKAVCEEKSDHLFCRDKLFVKCNGKEYIVDDNITNFIYCNNLKLNLSDYKVNGRGVFKKQ